MKLQDYFDKQKTTYISEVDKFQLYEQIITKKTQKSFSRKRSFLHIKSFAYTSFAVIFIIGIYGSWFINTNTNIDNNGFVVQRSPIIKNVQAVYVAKVVDFNWNFYIENNWIRLQTSNIQNNDTVILETWTELIFHIDWKTQTKILWPAKFTINKNEDENSYKINLSYYWDMVEIISLKDENHQNIEIETPELTVHSIKNIKPIKFQLIKENGKQIVRNEWSQLTLTNNKTNNNEITNIETKQLASIEENDITILSIEEFDKAIKEKEISQTFKLFTKDKIISTTNNELLSTNTGTTSISGLNITAVLDTKDNNINTWVTKQLTWILPQQLILSLEQNNTLRANLNPTFLNKNIKNMFISRIQDDKNLFNLNYNNLEKRIIALFWVFDLDYTKSNWNPNIINDNINLLEEQIINKYWIPPRYLNNLDNIKISLNIVFWQKIENITEDDILTKRNEILNSGQIQFK